MADQGWGIGKKIAALRCVELVENVEHVGNTLRARGDGEHPERERQGLPKLGIAAEFVADVVLRIGSRAQAKPHAAAVGFVEEMLNGAPRRPVEMVKAE